MDPLYVMVVVLTSISGLACLWMLWSLLSLRKWLSQRLLWRQLLALVATDFIWSCAGIPIYLPWFPVTHSNCSIFVSVHETLEFTSCLLEAQIALGFTLACFHSTWGSCALNWTWLLSLPAGAGLTLLIRRSTKIILASDGQCAVSSNYGWDVVVLSFCGGIVLTYIVGIARAMTSPEAVYHKVLWRTIGYLMCFLMSYGAQALQHLLFPGSLATAHVTWFLLCLNGAFHTACYGLQNRSLLRPHHEGKRRLRSQLSFHVDFSESGVGKKRRHPRNTQRGAESYFGFDGLLESLIFGSFDFSNTNITPIEADVKV